MTRKSAYFFCLALCTVAPGCSLLSSRGNAVPEGPIQVHEQPRPLPADKPPTAADEAPPLILPDQATKGGNPGTIEPLPPFEHDDGTNPPAGFSGVVTIDQAPPADAPKNAMYQVAQPEEKRFSDMARAMDHLENERHAQAIECLRKYDEPTQEFLLRILPLLAQIAKKSIDKLSPQEMENMNNLVRGIDYHLRTRCQLLVTKMRYAKRINGFADYVGLPDDHAFLAATSDRPGELVQLYVELKNFASVKVKEGEYLTKLACSLEVKNTNNKTVWGPYTLDKSQTTHCRSAYVNDYHGNFSFSAPALPPGTYKLTIQIVDETIPEHQRVARESLVFRVTPVANPLPSR